jgi:hypothetical protein
MPEAIKQQDLMVELDTSGDSIDIQLDEKTTQEKVTQEDIVIEKKDEREEYSEGVKKRIDRLTYKIRESERREKEALSFAEQVKKEKDSLEDKFKKLDDGYVHEFTGRVQSQLESAKNNLKSAVAKGDIDAQVAANQLLAKLAIEEERIRATEVQKKEQEAFEEVQYSARQRVQQPVQNNSVPKPDPRAEAWAEKNEWFGKDETMTYASFGIHKKLVEQEGYDPTSDEYYEEVDRRVREEFPHKFNNGGEVQGSNKPVQTVASATRTSRTGRKTVRLTPSQVAIAKKLGVPLEEYAKYVKE